MLSRLVRVGRCWVRGDGGRGLGVFAESSVLCVNSIVILYLYQSSMMSQE
jgi:hypothetical protein